MLLFRTLLLLFWPFQKIAIDLVDEFYPPSARGYHFTLSIIDTCSHWVEAIPLKYTTSEDVIEAIFCVFCRMGFPDVILPDNGTQRVYSNRGQKLSTLKLNDLVLILLPEKTDTLLTSWQGPFTVIKQCSPVNSPVDVRGSHKISHTDMLKWY